MKRTLQTLFVALTGMAAHQAAATVWTVSNDVNRPAQFNTVQLAVTAASPNDTILITGSATSYAGWTAQIPLVYYGESINGTAQFPQTTINGVANLNRLNNSMSASGTRMYGIRFEGQGITISGSFSGATPSEQVMSNIVIERCRFLLNSGNALNFSTGTFTQITLRNNVFTGNFAFINLPNATSGAHDIVFTNNVFSGDNNTNAMISGNGDYNGGILLRNNVFMSNTGNTFSGTFQDIVLENNIFYKAEPTGVSSSTWNNNLTYLCNANTIPYGSNFGSGNIVNQNPLFVNYPALGANFDFSHNYGLQAGSPALGTGTNGIDIGINSGNAPVTNIPIYAKIPGVTLLSIPVSSVPVGGTLQIQIEAESRD